MTSSERTDFLHDSADALIVARDVVTAALAAIRTTGSYKLDAKSETVQLGAARLAIGVAQEQLDDAAKALDRYDGEGDDCVCLCGCERRNDGWRGTTACMTVGCECARYEYAPSLTEGTA